jgi:hypothetical protein
MSRTTAINVLGTGILLVFAAGANAGGVVELTDAQLDAVTAGGLRVGPVPVALANAVAEAESAKVMTSSRTVTFGQKFDPDGMPAVANSYLTFSSAVSVAGGADVRGGSPSSHRTSVMAVNEQPFEAIGGVVRVGFYSPNLSISGATALHTGGAWVGNIPAFMR